MLFCGHCIFKFEGERQNEIMGELARHNSLCAKSLIFCPICHATVEVLVLLDFEGTMGDEITVRMGDVVKNVTKFSEEGWLEGELRGKRGIFPANFTKEVPVYLIGDSKREPRSIRTTKRKKQTRKCEVAFAYNPLNEDELQLVVGETIEILREIEDGWWMGVKNGKLGAFPSNFVREIFVSPKESKYNEGKSRPKLTDAVFNKEGISQRASLRNKAKPETEDEGWWEGEINGRCGCFPDNFVMLIPPMDNLQSGTTNQPPERNINNKLPVKIEASAMDKSAPTKTKDDKPEVKDLRSNPPIKVKLPSINKPSPPPVKDKPNKFSSKSNGDVAPLSPKQPEEKQTDQFDGVDVQTEKLCHPTANRAKPPQRRPPSGLVTASHKTPAISCKAGSLVQDAASGSTTHHPQKVWDSKTVTHKEEPTMLDLQAEIKELRMSLELLETRHDRDMQEVKEELREERDKRMALQDEVHSLRMKH
ncbi:hypothetical protein F7725_018104 [Dissostichus mawsoni]|uniref:SH3 domain-containing protein n=1 Tax=Dissostichus mawsoni TaxID=36200 RepID=A0A7J5XS64_DISMA|nr:hypothetical protein F7725_018104 [Dissostichus mawsoni]